MYTGDVMTTEATANTPNPHTSRGPSNRRSAASSSNSSARRPSSTASSIDRPGASGRDTDAGFAEGRPSTDTRRSVTFSADTIEPIESPDMGVRKSSRTNEESGFSSADESAPIIRRERGGSRKDYQSISPGIAAKSSGADNAAEAAEAAAAGGVSPGTAARRPREQARHAERERNAAQRAAMEAERSEQKWWKRAMEKYGSVELENRGSVARDHLALERTFLAWLRTSLSFASIGIAITQLFRLNTTIANSEESDSPSPPRSTADLSDPKARLRHVGKPLGATFIAISILVLFIGFHRYFESQHYVIRGKFPASRGSILLVALVACALIVSSLVVILAVAPAAFES